MRDTTEARYVVESHKAKEIEWDILASNHMKNLFNSPSYKKVKYGTLLGKPKHAVNTVKL